MRPWKIIISLLVDETAQNNENDTQKGADGDPMKDRLM